MEFNANVPIYLQLIDLIKQQIVSGKLQPGDKLSSVRDLALEYGVNPNTMQKALSELEWEKLVYTMRTAGRYVTEDVTMIQELRQEMAKNKIQDFFNEMKALGYQKSEIMELIFTEQQTEKEKELG